MSEFLSFSRTKRVTLQTGEREYLEQRARCILQTTGMFDAGCRLEPLALADSTQTWRVIGLESSAVLKIQPPEWAHLSYRTHAFLKKRGIDVTAILWQNLECGAVLSENLGVHSAPYPVKPDELTAIVRYLAHVHFLCRMDISTAMTTFPELAGQAFPTPARLAGLILHRSVAVEARFRARLSEVAEILSDWVGNVPTLIISDIKREHFCFRADGPVLVDLEMASFWDIAPANLATLFSFPRQFCTRLNPRLRRGLLAIYAQVREQLDGIRIDLRRLSRAVDAAEFLLAVELAQAGILSSTEWQQLTRDPDPMPCLHRSYMTRDRPFRRLKDASSVEAELGPTCFEFLLERLKRPTMLRVLDVGCGTGRALQELMVGWPQHQFIGIDLHTGPNMLNVFKADARHLPLASASVDVLLATQLLQYLPDKLAFLSEVYRVLRPQGLAVFAMTEHFDDESSFDPPLPRLLASTDPREAIRAYECRFIGSRRVISFAMFRLSKELRFACEFERATPSGIQEAAFPYLQSRYRFSPSLPASMKTSKVRN